MFYLFIYQCMPTPILQRDLWPTVGHLVHTFATQGGCKSNGSKYTLPSIPSAIYRQGMTFTYGLGGRLISPKYKEASSSASSMPR